MIAADEVYGSSEAMVVYVTALRPSRWVTDSCPRPLPKGGSMMELKKLLWPTDFSAIAEKALPYVKSISQRYDAEIHILYVIEDIAHHEGWYGTFEEKRVHELMVHANRTAAERLNQICEKYLEGCPLYIKHVAIGDPAREILNLVEREKVDLVVMTSHGKKGNFRFGSVAEKVVKNSPVPVTVIPIEPSR
jgi:nucleotide-binding universal stress UspA family protein